MSIRRYINGIGNIRGRLSPALVRITMRPIQRHIMICFGHNGRNIQNIRFGNGVAGCPPGSEVITDRQRNGKRADPCIHMGGMLLRTIGSVPEIPRPEPGQIRGFICKEDFHRSNSVRQINGEIGHDGRNHLHIVSQRLA